MPSLSIVADLVFHSSAVTGDTACMTSFMAAVEEVLEGHRPPPPSTSPSSARCVAVAVDGQVFLRAAAEQLVSEANAVLGDRGSIHLSDEQVEGRLGFALSYRNRGVHLSTDLSGRSGLARVWRIDRAASPDGGPLQDPPVALSSSDELGLLILNLLT